MLLILQDTWELQTNRLFHGEEERTRQEETDWHSVETVETAATIFNSLKNERAHWMNAILQFESGALRIVNSQKFPAPPLYILDLEILPFIIPHIITSLPATHNKIKV